MSGDRGLQLFGGIFLLVGVIMVVIAGFIFSFDHNIVTNGIKTTATVIGHSYRKSAAPIIEFTTQDGEIIEHISSTSTSPPTFKVGEKINIWYNSTNPQELVIDHWLFRWLAVGIVGGLGTLFTAIGGGVLLAGVAHQRKKEWLMQHGQPLSTTFDSVHLDTTFKVNGRSPWRIVSQGHDQVSNTVRTYESDFIWYNPLEFIKDKKVTVLIDPQNPKRYWMDTRFLPKKV